MKKSNDYKKVIGITVILLLVINVLLFAFRIYGSTIFWIIIILGGIIAYILPKIGIRKK